MSRHERFSFKGPEDLAAKARDLGVTVPYREDLDPLFRPLVLARGRRLPNRLVVHPMEGADATDGGNPGELTIRRYRRFAAGGCGLVWFEATAVVPEGRSNSHQLLLTQASLGSFKRLIKAAREAAGAGRDGDDTPLLILQLTHSGRFSKPEGIPRPVIARHDPILDPLRGTLPGDPAVTDADLDRLKDRFLGAVEMAAAAGFDGVDIKACHGYLLGELLAAQTRTDSRYGGPDLRDRARLLVETIAAARARFPELILASRLGVYDGLPYPHGFGATAESLDTYDLGEPLEVIGRLAEAGLDLLNITIGIPAYRAHFGRPFDKPAAGGTLPEEHPLEGVARLLRIAADIQKAFPALPVVGTGYSWLRGLAPGVAAGVLGGNGASLIGLGRLSFAYPSLARDLRAGGRLDPRKLCVACSGCTDLLRAGVPAGCIIRDRSVYRPLGR